MRNTSLLCIGLLALLLPHCRRAEETPSTTHRPDPATTTEPPRKGERSTAPKANLANPRDQGGREITRSSLSAEQNQLLDRHLRKRMHSKDSKEISTEPLADLLSIYRTATDSGAKLDALHGLAGRDDPEAFKLLMQASTQGELPERVAALEALAESPRAEHLPAVQSALQSNDMDVRLTGLSLLSRIHSESALPLWTDVMNHPSAEVTQFGFEQLTDLPPNLQVPIAKQALTRNEPWMTEQSLNLLGGITSKSAVEALIPFIEHTTSGDLAQSGLFFLLSEQFDSVEQATQWWQQNSETLGPDLQPKDLN